METMHLLLRKKGTDKLSIHYKNNALAFPWKIYLCVDTKSSLLSKNSMFYSRWHLLWTQCTCFWKKRTDKLSIHYKNNALAFPMNPILCVDTKSRLLRKNPMFWSRLYLLWKQCTCFWEKIALTSCQFTIRTMHLLFPWTNSLCWHKI